MELTAGFGQFILKRLLAYGVEHGILTAAFQLQPHGLHLVVVLLIGHFQLGAALYAHTELLLCQIVLLFQAFELILGLEYVLRQRQAALLHLYHAGAVGAVLLVPFVALALYGAHQVRVAQYHKRIAFMY